MGKKIAKRLPSKPSDLIRLALRDLAEVERSKKYTVDMDSIHDPDPDTGKCFVCFAGGVMARTCGADPNKNSYPSDFGVVNSGKLWSLDEFRVGDVYRGLAKLGKRLPDSFQSERDVTKYRASPAEFKRDMRRLAADLQKAGL